MLLRHLGEMLRSGLNAEQSFHLLANSRSGSVRQKLNTAASRLRSGASVREALEGNQELLGALLSPWELEFVGFGEKTGRLPLFLDHLANQADEQEALVSEIVAGSVYPVILVWVALLVGPLYHLIVSGPTVYFQNLLPPLIAVSAVFALGAWLWINGIRRQRLASVVGKIPVLGRLAAAIVLHRTVTGLALAYEAGMPMDEAWPLAANSSGDGRLIEVGRHVATAIRGGREASTVLERYPKAIPCFLLTAYRTGEATGRIDHELYGAARILRKHVTSLRELIVRLAGAGGYVMVALFLIRNLFELYRLPAEILGDTMRSLF